MSDRFEALLAVNSGSRKQRDDAVTRRDVALAHVQGARDRLRAAVENVARLRAGARKDEIARYVLANRAGTPVIDRGSPNNTGLPGPTA